MKRKDCIESADISLKALKSFGLNTGTGGEWLKANPKEALKFIADLGYSELEFGGDFGLGFDCAKKYIDDLGLKPLCHGAAMYNIAIDTATFRESIKEAQRWRKNYFICYYPFLDSAKTVPLDQWKQICDWCNEAGRVCKEEGLEFLYHNHDYEFQLTEDVTPFDIVLQNTDPQCVNMEMDLYWVVKGGACPISYMEKYPGRFPVLHVKDIDDTPERDFADVGNGTLDFPEIFSYSKIAGTKHYMVEHDKPKSGKDSITASGNYLRNLKYRER